MHAGGGYNYVGHQNGGMYSPTWNNICNVKIDRIGWRKHQKAWKQEIWREHSSNPSWSFTKCFVEILLFNFFAGSFSTLFGGFPSKFHTATKVMAIPYNTYMQCVHWPLHISVVECLNFVIILSCPCFVSLLTVIIMLFIIHYVILVHRSDRYHVISCCEKVKFCVHVCMLFIAFS